jgi:hypothetical protein
VTVIVEGRGDDSNNWIDTVQLQTDVEFKLPSAGLKVTSTAQTHLAALIVETGWYPYTDGVESGLYSVTISILEEAVLEREPSIRLSAQTWIPQKNQDGPSGDLLHGLREADPVEERVFNDLPRVSKSFANLCRRAGIEDFHFHDLHHYAEFRTMPSRTWQATRVARESRCSLLSAVSATRHSFRLL